MTHGFRVTPGVAEDWDSAIGVVPATFSRRWITLAQHRLPGGIQTFALHQDDALAVAMVGGIAAKPTGHVRFDPFRVLSGGSVDDGVVADGPHPWRGRAADEIFPCCLLMFPNYETAPTGHRAHDPGALDRFLTKLVAWCREHGARSIAVLFLREDHTAFLKGLHANGFDVVPMVERGDMIVTWSDFAGYLSSLPRKRRFVVRRELRDIAAGGVTIGERALGADESELIRLRNQLVARYGGVPDVERETQSLAHLREHFGHDNLLVVEARQGKRLLSFSILIRDGATWTILMSGTDHDVPAARFTYFATMFYRPAELAPSRGIKSIVYGLGTLEAKRLRGCAITSLSAAGLLIARGESPWPQTPFPATTGRSC